MRAELRDGSVAGIVLDTGDVLRSEPAHALRRPIADRGLAAIVLGVRARRRGPVAAALFVVASGIHAGAGLATLALRTKDPAAAVAAVRPPIQIEQVVELEPAEPPSPPAAAPPEPVTRSIARARAATAPEPPSTAPPPAEAAEVVAAADDASQALDFTGFDITTGNGRRYVGGVTASSGSSPRAVRDPVADRGAHPSARAGSSRARSVGAPRREWDCPWPAEADALSIHEQFVVIRAVVRADGTVASADLISDPGYGFGAVALACAREQRFRAATDDDGRPITATSPPVRVRFTRP